MSDDLNWQDFYFDQFPESEDDMGYDLLPNYKYDPPTCPICNSENVIVHTTEIGIAIECEECFATTIAT